MRSAVDRPCWPASCKTPVQSSSSKNRRTRQIKQTIQAESQLGACRERDKSVGSLELLDPAVGAGASWLERLLSDVPAVNVDFPARKLETRNIRTTTVPSCCCCCCSALLSLVHSLYTTWLLPPGNCQLWRRTSSSAKLRNSSQL
jgi:hypothetical protein